MCSGVDKAAAVGTPCTASVPAPLSDARILLNVDGYRFADTRQRGRSSDPGGIEAAAYDQARSEIEIHVQNSDIIGAVAFGVFTYYRSGSPARSVIDLGCVNPNPDPETMREDRAACRAMGFTSTGRNRIFGNNTKGRSPNPHVEVALEGRGWMIAQGNYWGDIQPADGTGDALGECAVFERPGRTPSPGWFTPCATHDASATRSPDRGRLTSSTAGFPCARIRAPHGDDDRLRLSRPRIVSRPP